MAWIQVGTRFINTDTISKVESGNGNIRVTYAVTVALPDGKLIANFDVFKDKEATDLLNAIERLAAADAAKLH